MNRHISERVPQNQSCDPSCPSGPPTEPGGTTGAGNLSPGSANRTGGATSGVNPSQRPTKHAKSPPPDAPR